MTLHKNEQSVSHIEINPPQPATHTIIWLHGLGADGNDFVPIVPELHLPSSMGVRFVFPHAPTMPITINNGYEMRAWYDIVSLAMEGEIDRTGIEKSNLFVRQLIENELARGMTSQHIILAGFSQGAVIALTTGLCGTHHLGGILALSGYLPLTQETLLKTSSAHKQTPIFIAHGTEDTVVPYGLGKSAYSNLKQAGHAVEWHSYPMAHSVCADEINDISQWIQTVWQ